MLSFRPALLACVALGLCAQAPDASDPVVVTIDGKAWRKSELEAMVRALPEAVSRNFFTNKKMFVETWALMQQLSKLAEADGLDKQPPHAQRLEYNRLQYLATAQLNAANARHPITEEEEKKYYEERKAEFARAKVKVLYVAFNDNPLPNPDPKAKKPLTSAQAKQKIDGLRKQLAGGADFLALVKQHSDDEESQAKEGDFGAFSPTDQNLPPVIKTAIFSLKPGQVSDPIEQANGYYLFRLESFTTPEFEEVKQDIFGKLQRERLDQWVESVKKSVKLEFAEPVYWTPPKP